MAEQPTVTTEHITQLRNIFFEKLDKEGAPCQDGFHPMDIKRVQTLDIWVQRFLEYYDLDMDTSLKMLWETCIWRKTYGTNDITEQNLNIDCLQAGILFPRNRDIDGKTLFIFKCKQYVRGERNTKELIRVFVYWMERLQREENNDLITLVFDMANAGLSNMDLDYTKTMINITKLYYPNTLNNIIVYELPWILNAAFKIIKAILPPKAVAVLRIVNAKSLCEYVSTDCMLKSWGGTDDYVFSFVPENIAYIDSKPESPVISKKVHFANLSPPETPMSDTPGSTFLEKSVGVMLRLNPNDAILFAKSGNELVGTVEITNIVETPVTYKIKTTSPEKFRVRPSTGILAPGANSSINVVLQQGHQITAVNRDKFLVMCMELNSDTNTSSQDIAELWKVTPSNSMLVEQHRLKCWPSLYAAGATEGAKNGNILTGSGLDNDRQLAHFSSTISQLVDTTNRLESQVKFNQTLQWITLVVFLFLSVAAVYILKMEIKSTSAEYCLNPHDGTFNK